ncbi:DUF732 domain-containing protein [Mycobacterium koreense]|uniref:Uncharacterized protein n=1 Tax=Mycolicibacillus koreensis TaxID=1069220 RepID=A0A7I7SK43_9MYCO|nr:DUF732 domain-containing protein [Mycolicibacillus koreensis]MCV7247438.1 DUF732 domain-containing protein [Mycolicibacillus koreensis]OSC33938.1 hypothetical protein B8W67_08840 [Mycolicibacillus koreensis]BBY56639.1 hypothetical protein MKOR_38900 [Mycolicibacillus koreensis]
MVCNNGAGLRTRLAAGLLGALGVAAVIGLAAPAGAEPGTDGTPGSQDDGFIDALRAAGITFPDPAQAVSAAHTMCGLADSGEPGLEILHDLKVNNPGISTDGAAEFAAIAANTYCPHELAPTG